MPRRYLESLIRLLYPATCEICRQHLDLATEILCPACGESLRALAWPAEQTLLDETFNHLDHVWTVFAYRPPFRELLRSVKYHRKDYLLKALRMPVVTLAQAITADFAYDALIPVPIDRQKYMERHFNQAEIIAGLLAPWVTPPVHKNLLVKSRPIPSQASLNRVEREINVYGAFRLKNAGRVRNRSFLLIDDVFTTGATAGEAARILKEAGAKRVDLFALARTVTAFEKARAPAPSSRFPADEGAQIRGLQKNSL